MMDFISIPAVIGIITLGIYKLFELFVCKKERLTIIEKMGEKFSPEMLEHKINFASLTNFSFSSLKWGCLFLGLGLGMLLAHLISLNSLPGYMTNNSHWIKEYAGLIYAGSMFLCGGLGLVAAFVIELFVQKKNK